MLKYNHFCSAFEKFDLFGVGINLRYDNSTLHRTTVGGLFSIAIYLALILQSIVLFQNLTDKTRPNTLQETIYVESPENTYLNHANFPLAFGLVNSKSENFLDPSIYKVTLWHKLTNKLYDASTNTYKNVFTNRVIKTEPCTPSHFDQSDIKDYFLVQPYNQLYCISLDETDIYIQGGLDNLIYARLDLIVEQCSGNNCQTPQKMQAQLSNGKLAVYFQDNIYQPSSKSNPFQPHGRRNFYTSGPEFTKALNLYFRNSFLQSDIGLVGENIKEDQIIQYAYDREQVVPKSGNILYDFFITHDLHYQNKYMRQYPKFDKALSQFGGIFNLLFLVGAIFCKPFSQIELNRKILNTVYDFSVNEETPVVNQSSFKNKLQDKYKIEEIKKSNLLGSEQLKLSMVNSKDIYKTISAKLNAMQGRSSRYDEYKSQENLTIGCMSPINPLEDSNKNPHQFGVNFVYSPNRQARLKNFKLISLQNDNRIDQSLYKQTETIQEKIVTEVEDQENQGNIRKNFELSAIQKNTEEVEQSPQPKKQIFFIKPFQLIKNYFSSQKNETNKLIEKGRQTIYSQINIIYIIKKLHELEKLKRLLLTEEQIKQFENLPKPVLYPTGEISIINQ